MLRAAGRVCGCITRAGRAAGVLEHHARQRRAGHRVSEVMRLLHGGARRNGEEGGRE